MFENIKSIFKKGVGDSVTWVFGNNSEKSNFRYSKLKGMSYYEKSLFLNRALNKRAEKVGQIKFSIKDLKGNEVINDYSKLLEEPNSYQTKTQFFRLLQKYMDIYGAFYILKDFGEAELFKPNTVPKQLILLNPLYVELHTDIHNEKILAYDYTFGGNSVRYKLDEIIYNNNPSPLNPILPESLMYSGVRALETNINSDEYQAYNLATGGKLDTIIQAKSVVNSLQLEEMKEGYRKSRKESHDITGGQEPFFAGGDIDIKRLGASSKDLEYVATKKMSVDDISILTNVPIEILGVTSGATFANAEASIRIFLKETIKPLQGEIIDVLNWRLMPENLDLTLIDPVPHDEDEKRKDLEVADKIHAMTINEKREALGLPEIKGGDDILVPFNLIALSAEKEPETKKKLKNLSQKEYSDKFKQNFVKVYSKKLDNNSKVMNTLMVNYFKAQEKRVIDKLQGTKLNVSEIFNITQEKEILRIDLMDVLKAIFIEQGKEHMLLISDIPYVFNSNAEQLIKNRAEFTSTVVNETTSKTIAKEMSLSIAENETRDQLVDRLEGKYEEFSVARAETIARTETHNILQNATLDASKQNGNEMKTWIWAPGVKGGVRDSHQSMDGDEVPINSSFKLPSGASGQVPGATGNAGEDINCQCTMI